MKELDLTTTVVFNSTTEAPSAVSAGVIVAIVAVVAAVLLGAGILAWWCYRRNPAQEGKGQPEGKAATKTASAADKPHGVPQGSNVDASMT